MKNAFRWFSAEGESCESYQQQDCASVAALICSMAVDTVTSTWVFRTIRRKVTGTSTTARRTTTATVANWVLIPILTTNAKQVSSAVENVNEITQEAASAAEEMSAATQQLSGMAQQLEKLVEQFKIAEGSAASSPAAIEARADR
jgi:methyl-accepting chemotaxis protein